MKSRIPGTKTSIFTVMSALARKTGAINLSQGFPDFDPPPRLFDLVRKYMAEGFNQYALMAGAPPLREAIARKTADHYDRRLDPETEICITNGATQALSTAILALVLPGDEVLVIDPCYDMYVPCIRMAGGTPIRIPMSGPPWRVDWDRVTDQVTDSTKAIIVNSPHNPTGTMLNETDMKALENLVERSGIYVISDEVYEHLLFDGRRHESVLRYDALYARCIAAYSFGKTFNNTGWKVGYAIAPRPIMDAFKQLHQFIVFSVNHPVQHALAEYMSDPATYLDLADFYREKRDRFLELTAGSRFRALPSAGTYFQLFDYSEISGANDIDYAHELTIDHGVASIPVSPFFEQPPDIRLLRFCFAKSNDILEEAAERLCAI